MVPWQMLVYGNTLICRWTCFMYYSYTILHITRYLNEQKVTPYVFMIQCHEDVWKQKSCIVRSVYSFGYWCKGLFSSKLKIYIYILIGLANIFWPVATCNNFFQTIQVVQLMYQKYLWHSRNKSPLYDIIFDPSGSEWCPVASVVCPVSEFNLQSECSRESPGAGWQHLQGHHGPWRWSWTWADDCCQRSFQGTDTLLIFFRHV